MKKILPLLLVFLLVFGCNQGNDQNAPAADQNNPVTPVSQPTILNVTVKEDENTPLGGVAVSLDINNSVVSFHDSKVTDGNGLVKFFGMPGGDYNISAEKSGFRKNPVQKTVDANVDNSLEVIMEKAVIPKGRLIVTVKDDKNALLSGVGVNVDSVEGAESYHSSAITDDNGVTNFADVFAGNYNVSVEKEGFLTQNLQKSVDANVDNNLGVSLAKPAPSWKPVKWKKLLNDANISIEPAGFLKVFRRQHKAWLKFSPDEIGELKNKTFEWRMKIIEGTSTGFAMALELFDSSKDLIKVQHSIDKVNVVGSGITKIPVNLKQDYHTFKLVINDTGKASIFVDGEEKASNLPLMHAVPVVEDKRMYFESYESISSIDYFYIDIDNDGTWDFKEEWDNLSNIS